MARSRLSGKVGAALDPCAAIQVGFELADGQEREIVFRLGLAGRRGRTTPASWCIASADRPPRAARSKPCGSTGITRSARCRWKRPTRRSTCWPTAGCSTRPWPAVCGAQRLLPIGGAFGFRDQLQDAMALVHAEPQLAARATAAVRRPSIPGRRCPALVASADGPRRAHALFRRLPVAAPGDVPLRADHRRHRRAGRDPFTSSKAARSIPRKNPITTCPAGPASRASLYEHCVRAIRHGTAVRRTRPAADGLR